MNPNTTQNIKNIVDYLSGIVPVVQKYFESDEFTLDENSAINKELRECFYIHGWDRPNKRFYRPFDEGKLTKDLQKIMDKYTIKM